MGVDIGARDVYAKSADFSDTLKAGCSGVICGISLSWGGEGEIIVFTQMLFGDNFESGDTSAWSAVVP